MMLSLYRRREPVRRVDDVAVIAAASRDDVKLLGTALRSNRAALITLDGKPTIAKAEAAGDDRLSFEGLYDECLTQHDLERMQRAKVSSPDELPASACAVRIQVLLDDVVDVPLLIAVKTRDEVYGRIKQLFADDAMFRAAFYEVLLRVLYEHAELSWRLTEFQFAEGEPMPQGEPWHFPAEA